MALVTGAGVGIGRAIACAVGREGARVLVVDFNADTAAQMRSVKMIIHHPTMMRMTRKICIFFRWNFKPQQPVVYVHPGETALAFYTARNPTEKFVLQTIYGHLN